MTTHRYQLIDAFSIQDIGGGSIVFPPGDALVRASPRGCSFSLNSYEPVAVRRSEIDRLVAAGIAVPHTRPEPAP